MIVLILGLAACSKDEPPPREDLSKLPPEQQCAKVNARMLECKDTILGAAAGELKKAGVSDEHVAELGKAIGAARCDRVNLGELAMITACYDSDCKKVASCLMPILLDATRGAGDSSDRTAPE